MKPLLAALIALAGCAEPRAQRRYCMERMGLIDVSEYGAAFTCDKWCHENGGCLCKLACPCKRR